MTFQLFLGYFFQVILLLKIYTEQTNGLTDYMHSNTEQTLEASLGPNMINQTNEYIITNTGNIQENNISRRTFSNRIGSSYVSSAKIGISSKNM